MNAPGLYQRELLLVGGESPTGEAAFRLHWSGDVLRRPRCPDQFFDMGHDCWMLLEWRPCEATSDPWKRGRYEVAQIFRKPDNTPSHLDTPALNVNVLRMMVSIISRARHDSMRKRFQTWEEAKQKEELDMQNRIADNLQDACPAYRDAVSYHGQTNTRSVVQQRMEAIERNMHHAHKFRENYGKGPFIRQ